MVGLSLLTSTVVKFGGVCDNGRLVLDAIGQVAGSLLVPCSMKGAFPEAWRDGLPWKSQGTQGVGALVRVKTNTNVGSD